MKRTTSVWFVTDEFDSFLGGFDTREEAEQLASQCSSWFVTVEEIDEEPNTRVWTCGKENCDFTTIAAWEEWVNTNLVEEGRSEILRLYDDE